MPSFLVAYKVDKDGKEIPGTRVTTPHPDYGFESVGAAEEEERLRKLGYHTEIRRATREATREGGDLVA